MTKFTDDHEYCQNLGGNLIGNLKKKKNQYKKVKEILSLFLKFVLKFNYCRFSTTINCLKTMFNYSFRQIEETLKLANTFKKLKYSAFKRKEK
ncbi:hypothetical protein BpHYR1_026351 [Brachionus plicatilis]|uniref:Uncharacterized protein n=1 Tax=Brachionus plicatilis TaxID=10195 RepID=A0A3M7P4W4_BRAPC|nr:hypothetical protein BpHYR1_026351 [Brachionus plicatilis]